MSQAPSKKASQSIYSVGVLLNIEYIPIWFQVDLGGILGQVLFW